VRIASSRRPWQHEAASVRGPVRSSDGAQAIPTGLQWVTGVPEVACGDRHPDAAGNHPHATMKRPPSQDVRVFFRVWFRAGADAVVALFVAGMDLSVRAAWSVCGS
jgi:hypothetical protein